MTPRPTRLRSGITLTEILISILIMGVGLISLATLFPLGLVRLREAARQSRSGLLAETAVGDTGAKNLFSKPTFSESYYGAVDPFLMDALPTSGNVTLVAWNPGVGAIPAAGLLPGAIPVVSTIGTSGGGLPVCYDPLWRAITDLPPPIYNVGFPSGVFAAGVSVEARFGAGVIGSESNLRSDTGTPSAHGLQRISNFVPYVSTNAFLRSATGNWPFTYLRSGSSYPSTLRDLAAETFVSPDDIVMQNSEANATILNNPNGTGTAGSIVPEFFNVTIGGVSTTEIRTDYRYTWFFTGRQVDTTNGSVFEGDIVVCDGRPFGLDPVLYPITGGTPSVASGETTIEGIFGYSTNLQDVDTNGHGYGAAADRTVLLRWPALSTDPEVRVGGWIADVTYERFQNLSDTRANTYVGTGASYPMQRCHWYQVIKKGDIETETIGGNTYRRMIVYTNTPIRSRTLLGSGGAPVYVNAALVMPTVVNVFSKTFYTR